MDTSSPATLGDLKALEKSLLADIDSGFRGVHRSIDEVLTVLVNVNNRLTGAVDDHEKRIRILENAMTV